MFNQPNISSSYPFFQNLPFGETMVELGGIDYDNPYKFNGKELDEETGNYYYGARYYNPKVSQWLSVDPLAEKYAGFSPYNYTLNNPVMLVDVDGKCFKKVGKKYVPCDDAKVGATTTGAFGYSWTMTEGNGWQLTNGADPNSVNAIYTPIKPDGSANYYIERYKQHIKDNNTRPPDYLLEYGYNNRAIYFEGIYSGLSEIGKKWFEQTKVGLQKMIENKLSVDPSIALRNDDFRKFAFNSHESVYLEGGLMQHLPYRDLVLIGTAPPISDLLSYDGLRQVFKIIPKLPQPSKIIDRICNSWKYLNVITEPQKLYLETYIIF